MPRHLAGPGPLAGASLLLLPLLLLRRCRCGWVQGAARVPSISATPGEVAAVLRVLEGLPEAGLSTHVFLLLDKAVKEDMDLRGSMLLQPMVFVAHQLDWKGREEFSTTLVPFDAAPKYTEHLLRALYDSPHISDQVCWGLGMLGLCGWGLSLPSL